MIERLDTSFDGQRRFVANASHELRTPLTVGRTLVELAMHRKNASDDAKLLGHDLLEINSQHDRLITGLMLLACAENDLPERTPVDLADLISYVASQSATDAERAQVTLYEGARPATTFGDALLLERLVHNLIENAICYNIPSNGWVRIASRTLDDGHVEVEVTNTGPQVATHEIPRSSRRSAGSEPNASPPPRAPAWACPSSDPSPAPTAETSPPIRTRTAA